MAYNQYGRGKQTLPRIRQSHGLSLQRLTACDIGNPYGAPPPHYGGFPGANAPPGMGASPGLGSSDSPEALAQDTPRQQTNVAYRTSTRHVLRSGNGPSRGPTA
jgi:hypothetical protein